MELHTFSSLSSRLAIVRQFDHMSDPSKLADLVGQLRPRLRKVIGVTIGKGGEGKTTTAANLAYMLAEQQAYLAQQGRKALPVLYIELDSNGNGRMDLGIHANKFDDDGAAFVEAVTEDKDFAVIRNVRPYLDMTVAGSQNARLNAEIARMATKHLQAPYLLLAMILAQISHLYAWIIIDFSPGDESAQRLGLAAVTHLVAPIKGADDASIAGLATLANLVGQVRLINREVGIAAIGFLGFKKKQGESTAELDVVRAKIEVLLEKAKVNPEVVMQTHIRDARSLATACRNNGMPARELALAANEMLIDEATGKPKPRPRDANGRLVDPEKALELAEDYTVFTNGVIEQVLRRNAELQGAS